MAFSNENGTAPEDPARPRGAQRASAGVTNQYVYFDEPGAAAYILGDRDKFRRLKDLRQRGGGPRYIRIGCAVRYRSDWLDAWAEANAVSSTSEETARKRAGHTRAAEPKSRLRGVGQPVDLPKGRLQEVPETA